MTLMVAGVAFLIAFSAWHLSLAVRSTRAAARLSSGAHTAAARELGVNPDGGPAAPYVLWLVLVRPTPAALSAARAIRLRPRCRTRVVVIVDDRDANDLPEHPDAHYVAIPADLGRAALLNRAYRFVRERSARDGEDPRRAVLGVVEEGAAPDRNLAVAVWHAFADEQVGAVQARVQTQVFGTAGSGQEYESGVLADATALAQGRRGASPLGVNGAFVRLSELRRLGAQPWRSGATEGVDLGLRLRRLGVRVQHDPRLLVTVRPLRLAGLLRQRTRWAQGHLQSRPLPGERAAWLGRVFSMVLPGLAVPVVLAWFAVTAWWLSMNPNAAVEPQAQPWWLVLPLGELVWPTPTWSALVEASAVWVGALAVPPAIIWWVARQDLAGRVLWRGALTRPLLLLVWPVAFGRAVLRQLFGRRSWEAPVRRTFAAEAGPALADDLAPPVFVDTSGRRRRRMSGVAVTSSALGLGWLVLFAYVLVAQPISPSDSGLLFPAFNANPETTSPTASPTPDATTTKPAVAPPRATTPSATPSATPSESPSATPSESPSATPSETPSTGASESPSATPSTGGSSASPSGSSESPTGGPDESESPTGGPDDSESPTGGPDDSESPTSSPEDSQSDEPSDAQSSSASDDSSSDGPSASGTGEGE